MDPTQIFKYQPGISFSLNTLVQMQIIDNLLVVHNMDEQKTLLYDMKLTDFQVPLTGSDNHTTVDYSKIAQDLFASDLIFPEDFTEAEEQHNAGVKSGQLQQISTAGDLGEGQQAKEFVQFKFKVEYTSDEETPLKAMVNIPVDS